MSRIRQYIEDHRDDMIALLDSIEKKDEELHPEL